MYIMPKVSKDTKKFLQENRKSSTPLPKDKELRTFLNVGGRTGAKQVFFSLLKKAVKPSTS